MIDLDSITLENIDPEDIEDILGRLEKSFGIKYGKAAFNDAKTFGGICHIIESHITLKHQDDCTTQQAFYKLRKAISLSTHIDVKDVQLEMTIEYLFPLENRRHNLAKLQQHLKIKLDILRMKEWLVWLLFLGFFLSLTAFFFSCIIAVSGLVFFYLFSTVAIKFSTELDFQTVRQLTEKIARENYLEVRRHKETVNRNEIFKTIQDAFSSDLGLDKELLTKDASLGWG